MTLRLRREPRERKNCPLMQWLHFHHVFQFEFEFYIFIIKNVDSIQNMLSNMHQIEQKRKSLQVGMKKTTWISFVETWDDKFTMLYRKRNFISFPSLLHLQKKLNDASNPQGVKEFPSLHKTYILNSLVLFLLKTSIELQVKHRYHLTSESRQLWIFSNAPKVVKFKRMSVNSG
jgi:hypothetical protein